MRVATYSQRTAATRASLIAIGLLIVTILQGTSATLTLIYHFQKSLEPISALLWLSSYLVALFGLMLTHGLNWIFWLSRYRFLLVILLFGTIASIFWSIDSGISTTRTMHLIGCCIIAIYLGFMVPLATTLTVFAWVMGFILLASVGAVFAMPDLGIEAYEGTRVWRGILTSKNTLGFWAAVAVLLYISQWSRAQSLLGQAVCIGMVLLSLATLYFSHSATSLLALVVGGSIALYFFIAIRFELGFIRMVVMAALFAALVALAFMNINTAELIGRSGDLTGRGEVWEQTWRLILQKPLTGYGYGAIWNPNDSTIWIQQKLTDFTWVVYHAHNGFLQVASEIGLPLTCIALLMVVQQLIEIFYCQYQRQQLGVLFVLGFVIIYLVTNYSEARFLVNRELYWIFFLALPISMLRQVTLVVQADGQEVPGDDGDDPFPSGDGPQRDDTVVHRREQKEELKNRVRSIDSDRGTKPKPPLTPAHATRAGGVDGTAAKDQPPSQREEREKLKQQKQKLEADNAALDEVFARKPGAEESVINPDDYFDRFASDSDPLNDDRYEKIANADFNPDPGDNGPGFTDPDIDLSQDQAPLKKKAGDPRRKQ